MSSSRAFSLVELMMVVAITMTLAAIAIPLVANYQLRARSAELPLIVQGIATHEDAHLISEGTYVGTFGWGPDANPSRADRVWSGISAIGFVPDGTVRGSYIVNLSGGTYCNPTGLTFESCGLASCVGGMSDLDMDSGGRRACYFTISPNGAPATWTRGWHQQWDDTQQY